jgi:GAF domain-containing protein/HAMP domain-containing protein
MNPLNKLNLRTRLIGSFILMASVIVILFHLIPRLTFQRLERSIPFAQAIGQTRALANRLELEAVEFIAASEDKQKIATELADAAKKLDDLSTQISQFEKLPAEDADYLIGLLKQLEATALTTIETHDETMEMIETLEMIEDELEEMLEDAPGMSEPASAQYLDKLSEIVSLLQLEAIEFVVTGEDKTLQEYQATAAELEPTREKLREVAKTESPENADFIAKLDETAGKMATISGNIMVSHTETLELLEKLEVTEEHLGDALADVQTLSESDMNANIYAVRRNSILTTGLVSIVAVLLGLLLTRRILIPLHQLTDTAEKLGSGDFSARVQVKTQDEIGELARVFNLMVEQFQEAFHQAEQYNQQRAQQLEVTAAIARRLTTILDVDQLLQEVVTNIQNAFGYYHVHIYIIDQIAGDLVMREGTGEVGQQLKAKGHRLKAGEGIVGKVASSGEAFFAKNVDEVPDFVRNPLLSKTQAELAVPIRKGDIILGVLDMQSEEVGSFSEEDLTLMQAIADQVAVVLENARLFREAQAAAVEAERLTHRLTRESWQDVGDRVSTTGYVFTKSGVTSVSVSGTQLDEDEAWLPIMAEAVRQKKLTHYVSESDNDERQVSCLSIPLMLRNEVIGVVGIERATTDIASDVSGEEVQEEKPRAWTEDELATIQTIAEQIALALDAARLARETERAAWRDRVVSESTARVWATDEVEEVMKAAVTQLGDRLRASEVVIRLGSEDDLSLE